MAETTKGIPMNEGDMASPERHRFEKDIAELISVMSKTVWPGKEIFLRELIRLSADNLAIRDQERWNNNAQNGREEELLIHATFSAEQKRLIVTENGVGESKSALINRGTLQSKGTKAVISALRTSNDLSEVELFDVGFYTMFAVADRVTIKCKENDKAWLFKWDSATPEALFTFKKVRNQSFECGTQFTLYLKDDAAEYINRKGFEVLVKKHRSSLFKYKIQIQSNSFINGSEEGNLTPRREAHTEAVAPTDEEEPEHNIFETPQGTSSFNRSVKASSPSVNDPGTAKAVGKGMKRKSITKHLQEGSPAVKKMSSGDVVASTPDRTIGEAGSCGKVVASPCEKVSSLERSTPKTGASDDYPTTSMTPGTLAYAKKHGKSADLNVKVIKCLEEGRAFQTPGRKAWFRGKYEIADETDRATLKVFGGHLDMSLFSDSRTITIHNAMKNEDQFCCNSLSSVRPYEGDIDIVKNIAQKRRRDEAKSKVTLALLKEINGQSTSHIYKPVKVYIEKIPEEEEGNSKELIVKDRKNSPSSYRLMIYGSVAEEEFIPGQRYHFYNVTYVSEWEKFKIGGQEKPKLVSSRRKKHEQTGSPSEMEDGTDSN